MDGARLDALARSLTDARSRRGALRSLLVGPLGLLGWSAMQNASAKDCKKIPDKKKRKKCLRKAKSSDGTQCLPACAGKTCGADGCGGSCGSCGPADSCENGSCVNLCAGQSDGITCGGSKTCSGEICTTSPTCQNPSSGCATDAGCCSTRCVLCDPVCPPGFNKVCGCSRVGEPCHDTTGCCAGQGLTCRGFVCRTA